MSRFGIASNVNSEGSSSGGGIVDPPQNAQLITNHKLNGHNYLPWSQSVLLYIKGKGKADFITEEVEIPEKTDKGYKLWESENSKVMSWLINSMIPEVGENFLLYDTAYDVWEAVKETYSNKDNISERFRIEGVLHEVKQGASTVVEYYNNLSRLWQQEDMFNKLNWKCTEDGSVFRAYLEEMRIFKFLIGLNDNLDEVRGRILSIKPIPSIREVVAEVRREESRKRVMLKSDSVPTSGETSALATRGNSNNPSDGETRRGRPWCDHCRRPGHYRETCWKIHGKPADWKPRSQAKKGYSASGNNTGDSEGNLFSKEQIEQLQKLFGCSLSTSVGTGSMVQSGTFPSALSVKNEVPRSWIIDSGATDHMTGNPKVFNTFEPCKGNFNVKVADGTLSKVIGYGTVIISKNLVLQSVLFVPNLDCNLLSISKLTYDKNCLTKFYPTYCVFQDLISERTIGTAELRSGLYILEADPALNLQCNSTQQSALQNKNRTISNKESTVMLWHYRLGHPNFLYLEKLFPELFINKSPREFSCEVCELSKHTRSSLSPSIYHVSKPFALIHSDVWGPSKIPTVTGAKWFISFIDDHTRITWVFLMKEKSEVATIFKNFNSMIKTQFQTRVQILRTDNGKEFVNNSLVEYCLSEGIIHQTSCVYTPQQNGVSERKNRHLLEVARSLLFTMHVPKHFWGDAVLTAVHLINRQPSRVLNFHTPTQTLLDVYPHNHLVSNIPLKVFGCTVFVHDNSPQRSKLDPRSFKCVFLGYSPSQKGYRCYHPTSRKMFVSIDVTFLETQPFFNKTAIQGGKELSDEFQFLNDFAPVLNPNAPDSFYPSFCPSFCPTQRTCPNFTYSPAITDFECDINPTTEPVQPVKTDVQPVQKEPVQPVKKDVQPDPSKLIVYSRQPKHDRNIFNPDVTQQVHEFPLRSGTQQSLNAPSFSPNEPVSDTVSDSNSNSDDDDVQSENDLPIAQRRPIRKCREKPVYPLSKYVSYEGLSPTYKLFAMNVSNILVPANIQEALSIPEWRKAVQEELMALQKNGTWELTVLPEGKKTVGCKWVFVIKHKADGSVERYKARLVAKGFTQSYGIDYEETFAPVAKLNTVRVLLSIAVNLDWQLHQMDVKNAFLNGDLLEEVYMDSPPGLEAEFGNKVCRLRKSLYGLKQSPRAWFEKFTRSVKEFGYHQCQTDHTLFVNHGENGSITILIVYVDDIIITGNSIDEIQKLKGFLGKQFEIKDLGNLRYFLGMEVARSKKGICVNQCKYVIDLLKETGMTDCKPAETPMDSTTKLGLLEGSPPVDKGRYQRLVGKLIYLSHTRPDISFAVSMVSQFMHNPNEEHMGAVQRILRYLKMTPGQGIWFRKNECRDVSIYTDADWAGSILDRRSTSGYCSFVWGNLVTWRSKKQSVVSRSSAEAEFRALAHGISEGIWLQRMLEELKVPKAAPIQLFCDNQATISMAKNPVHHDRTKHVEIDRHFIKEKIEMEVIKMNYVSSKSQIADIFTKALARVPFEDLCFKLGMINIHRPA